MSYTKFSINIKQHEPTINIFNRITSFSNPCRILFGRLRHILMSCHLMSCHLMSCHLMSCHFISSYVISCYVMSTHVMSCHLLSCHFLLWHIFHSLHFFVFFILSFYLNIPHFHLSSYFPFLSSCEYSIASLHLFLNLRYRPCHTLRGLCGWLYGGDGLKRRGRRRRRERRSGSWDIRLQAACYHISLRFGEEDGLEREVHDPEHPQ